MKIKVTLGTMQNASKLVSIAESISCDVDLCYGRYIVDAKSMLGVLSLPDFAYGELQIPVETEEEKRWILEKLAEAGLLYEKKRGEIMLRKQLNGIQHVGIPTNDIETTVEFYRRLGFEVALQTVNEEANEKVAFLKLNNLVIETYENKAAKMESGAIDHVAIDVKDIEKVYELINHAGLNTTRDTIHFLPFWENGVRFFTIEGPNKEKIEFSQYL